MLGPLWCGKQHLLTSEEKFWQLQFCRFHWMAGPPLIRVFLFYSQKNERTQFCGSKAFTSTLPFPAPELFRSSRGASGALPYLIFRIVLRWQGSHFTRFPSRGACSWSGFALRTWEVEFNQAEGIKLGGCVVLNWGLRVEVHLWLRSVFICGSALNTRAHR